MENTYDYRIYPSPVLRRAALRRKKEFRRKVIKFCVAFSIILFIGAAFLSVRSFAGSKKDSVQRVKYYKSIVIEKGDTVNSIADKYISSEYSSKKEYISELVNINHIADVDCISAGSHLIVPYFE